MYTVKYGGKKGKTMELEESPDLVAVRTKDNQEIEHVKLSRAGREVMEDSTAVVKFPEAGITVIKVSDTPASVGAELESFSDQGRVELGHPPAQDTTKRDATRATLKEEDNIRFAGRVLQDKATGEVTLYTENFFIKFFDATPEKKCEEIIQKYQLTVKSKLPFAKNAYFVSASEGTGLQVFNIAQQILAEKIVEYCHPELVQERRFKGIHPLQWHLGKTKVNGNAVDAHVNIEGAWKITRGKGLTIAIVDDGVDMEHPEFKGRIVHPFDATENNNNAQPKADDDNHGTACAGMACATGLENGASGTAPEAFLMPIRLRSGLGSMAEANAFAWAADHGADVISCSWGPTDGEWWNPGDAVHNRQTMLPDSTRLAMDYALTKGRNGKGAIILFAAGNGNEATANDGYVSHPGVMAIAACNDTGKRSVYSDYGTQVWASFPSGDFAWKPFLHPAPLSEGLRTTDRLQKVGYNEDNYTNAFGGTSGACPGMAGVVALMLAVNPDLTPPEVKEIVRKSCDIIDSEGGQYNKSGHSDYYGHGRINAEKAVKNARSAVKTERNPVLEGNIRFEKIGDVHYQASLLNGSNLIPARKMLGLALKAVPNIKNLSIVYKLNIGGEGITMNASPGVYAGATDARKKVIGISIALEGKAAKDYDIEYTIQLEKKGGEIAGKNGAFCGTLGKTGKAIVAISIALKKK